MLDLNGEEPAQASCLTLSSLTQSESLEALTNDQLYVPSLELVVVLGTVIAVSNPMDGNPVASGVETNLLVRLTKYGSEGVVDLSTYGLASIVLCASKGIADLAHYGAEAVALAWALATTTQIQGCLTGPESISNRLIVPTAAVSHAVSSGAQVVCCFFSLFLLPCHP